MSPLVFAVLASPISLVTGVILGFHRGRIGTSIRSTLFISWGLSMAMKAAAFTAIFGFVTVFRISAQITLTGVASDYLYTLAACGIVSLIFAPMAAFIAHNFGTRQRIRDELGHPRKQIRE